MQFDGSIKDAAATRERPLLLNLWSTTCNSCCIELVEWSKAAADGRLGNDIDIDLPGDRRNRTWLQCIGRDRKRPIERAERHISGRIGIGNVLREAAAGSQSDL